ncbi:MAG: type VI secretion system TssO, partial [Bacteroidia bacterium]|nr:type VI secretion system TssO [Bacteroidia bacterium]
MEPLNKKERSKGTMRFLVLFIAGILIVLIPFYFLIRLPEKEQQVSSDQLNSLQGQLNFQKEFTIRMDSAMRLMDRYAEPGVDIDKLNPDIGLILSEMDKSIGTEVNSSTGMYKSVINVLTELKKARSANLKNSADLAKALKDLADVQKELEKAKEKPSDSLEH